MTETAFFFKTCGKYWFPRCNLYHLVFIPQIPNKTVRGAPKGAGKKGRAQF